MRTRKKALTLGKIGEIDLLAQLCHALPGRPEVIVGPGDDCAVVRPESKSRWDWLIKSDPVIENVHFTRDAAPENVGHKAVARVFSDIAAMGGEPLWLNINISAPADTPAARIAAVYRGAKRTAAKFGAAIVGGDISSGTELAIHVFGVGRVPRGRAILRSGAQPGDKICVTGTLGGSRAGKHIHFTPRLAEGQWLQAGGWAAAMIDISDGLALDLWRLANASGVGAVLTAASLPIDKKAYITKAASRLVSGAPTPFPSAVAAALFDGEDFELLFTVRAKKFRAFTAQWSAAMKTPCRCIGEITAAEAGLCLKQSDGTLLPIPKKGYEHFRYLHQR